MMRILRQIVLLFTLVLATACGNGSSSTIGPNVLVTPTKDQVINEPTDQRLVPTDAIVPIETTSSPAETTAEDCLGGEISPIGQSIAEDYESASYEQVITWFCDGAEFEDILVALETETLVDTSAQEMLQMLADGFTWDEIWQLMGLMD